MNKRSCVPKIKEDNSLCHFYENNKYTKLQKIK